MTMPLPVDAPKPKRSLLARAFLVGLRASITLLVIAGVVLTIQFASNYLAQRAAAVPAPEPAPLIPVSASIIEQESGYWVERRFIGQVEAQRTVNLSFELAGKLNGVFFDEGDTVGAEEAIATLDTALLTAERDRLQSSRRALEAQLRFAQQTVERSAQLNERGFASQARLDEALSRQDELTSRIAELDASLSDVRLRLEKSRITAPFDGRVAQRHVDAGETLRPGDPVLELVESGAPQVRVGVPLDIAKSDLAEVTIEVADGPHTASLISLRPDVDPLTRTRTAIFALDDDIGAAIGQTARLILKRKVDAPGIWIATTALKEGVRGQWNVLVTDPDAVVRVASVEVLHAEEDRVFARGVFPEGTMLINRGPQRVTPGQRVAPQISQ